MKMMKKVMALILSLLVVMCMAVPVVGADPTYSITIENAVENQTYKAYKIFDVTYDTGKTTYAYTILSSSAWYSVVSTYAQTDSNGLKLTATKADATIYNVTVDANFSAAAFAEYLKEKVEPASGSAEVTDIGTKLEYDSTTGKASANLTSLGYYFVTSSVGSLCNLTTTNPTASIFDKNAITFDKTVDDIDVEIGQKVNYTINGAVPDITGYTKYEYTVTDTMSKGLTFNKDLKIKIGDSDINLTQVTDTSTPLTDRTYRYTDSGFELYFDMASVQNKLLTTNASIVITYSATVNENAIRGENGNPNTATLKYSNNPTDSTKYDSITDKEIVYTVDVNILKHITDNEDELLAGAEFILYRVSKTKNPEGTETTEYYEFDSVNKKVSWENEETNATTMKTTDDGKAKFVGIQANSEDEAKSYQYYLREIKAPEGYNLLETDIQVNINRQETQNTTLDGDNDLNDTKKSTIKISLPPAEADGNDTELTDATVKVGNSSGSELPETGGIGTTIFYVVGGIMMVVAIVLLVTKKKMSKK